MTEKKEAQAWCYECGQEMDWDIVAEIYICPDCGLKTDEKGVVLH